MGFLGRLFALVMVFLPALAFSQEASPTIGMLSKDNVQALFSMTQVQWRANVRRTVAAGAGSAMETPETGVALVTRTPEGDLMVVRPLYTSGTAKPGRIQLTIRFGGARAELFTDAVLKEAVLMARLRMEPEYDLIESVDRTERSVFVVFDMLENTSN